MVIANASRKHVRSRVRSRAIERHRDRERDRDRKKETDWVVSLSHLPWPKGSNHKSITCGVHRWSFFSVLCVVFLNFAVSVLVDVFFVFC